MIEIGVEVFAVAVRHVDGHVREPQVILVTVFRRSAALLGRQDSPPLVEFCFAEEDAGDFEQAAVVAEPAVAPVVGLPAGPAAVVEEP